MNPRNEFHKDFLAILMIQSCWPAKRQKRSREAASLNSITAGACLSFPVSA
jgi:hypothetical protein